MTTVGWGADQFRVGPWNADAAVAYMALAPDVTMPSVGGVRRMLEQLAADGYRAVTTAALRPQELAPFLQAGFTERERLTILHHSLDELPAARSVRADGGATHRVRLRRAVRRDRAQVLEVDHVAFSTSWQLDDAGLDDALAATPRSRFRVAVDHGVCGYAVCGRAADTGYLQRLAVLPDRQGGGIGARLVIDALAWLRRRGAHSALVNTQDGNERALDLYRRLGFRPESYDLVVLERSIP
jgi:ribosomal protein S18 acetylase RimI-like enzyme